MNNTDVSIRFSQGATKGTGSNLFIDGDTIYSYGYHFKVAVRYGDYYLFNSNGYSSSTAKHQNHVIRELLADKIIECPDCDINKAKTFLKDTIKYLQEKQARARKTDYSFELQRYGQMLDRVISLELPY